MRWNGNQAIFWAKDNHPTTPIDNLYWLFNSSFGVGPNHCVDPVTGYFYRFSPKLGYTCPGGIYDEMVWWSSTITTWFDYIDYLNTTYQSSGNGSQPTTNPFYLGMTEPSYSSDDERYRPRMGYHMGNTRWLCKTDKCYARNL